MRKLLLAATVATLAVAPLTASAGQPGKYRVIGAGMVSCGSWTAERRQPRGPAALQQEQWVLGFLSGTGFTSDESINPLDGTDADGVWAWVDNYCRAHPIENIATAAAEFYRFHPSGRTS